MELRLFMAWNKKTMKPGKTRGWSGKTQFDMTELTPPSKEKKEGSRKKEEEKEENKKGLHYS
jgi:hypothetical protein